MGNNKKNKGKKKQERLIKDALSMQCFLVRFLGITDKNLVQADLTHNDLKALFPHLQRTGFNQVLDDPALVHTGEVLLVTDSAHNTVPYVNKFNLDVTDVMDDEEWNEPETWHKTQEKPNIQDYDLSSLTTYELAQLLQLFAKSGQRPAYEVIRRELIFRADSNHANKQSKQKALRKDKKRFRKFEDEDY